ncbi:Uncharacterised protein [Salmonella enterica subsp. enterica serovar Typhi]|nr:Uncharacterised protein [Salmonella enterica subsp. enterica serovar Typhi]
MLFCKQHAAVALFPYLWIDGIPDNHTQQDSQGQGAEPRACNSRDSAAPQGDSCNDGAQSEPRYKMPHCTTMILQGEFCHNLLLYMDNKVTVIWFKNKIDYIFIINLYKW